jgi:hypothetical protein
LLTNLALGSVHGGVGETLLSGVTGRVMGGSGSLSSSVTGGLTGGVTGGHGHGSLFGSKESIKPVSRSSAGDVVITD